MNITPSGPLVSCTGAPPVEAVRPSPPSSPAGSGGGSGSASGTGLGAAAGDGAPVVPSSLGSVGSSCRGRHQQSGLSRGIVWWTLSRMPGLTSGQQARRSLVRIWVADKSQSKGPWLRVTRCTQKEQQDACGHSQAPVLRLPVAAPPGAGCHRCSPATGCQCDRRPQVRRQATGSSWPHQVKPPAK